MHLLPRYRYRIHGGQRFGVGIFGAVTKGRLESCDVTRNRGAGIVISWGADPLLLMCK